MTLATMIQTREQAIREKEDAMIALCRNKETAVPVLISAFEELEKFNPSKEDLLKDPDSVRMIDGR